MLTYTLIAEVFSAQTEVLDVETHRAPIDEVVADLYERWLAPGHPPRAPSEWARYADGQWLRC